MANASNEFPITPTEGNFCLYPSSMTLGIGHTGNNVSILSSTLNDNTLFLSESIPFGTKKHLKITRNRYAD